MGPALGAGFATQAASSFCRVVSSVASASSAAWHLTASLMTSLMTPLRALSIAWWHRTWSLLQSRDATPEMAFELPCTSSSIAGKTDVVTDEAPG